MNAVDRAYNRGIRDAADKIKQLRKVAEAGMRDVIEIGTDRGATTVAVLKAAEQAVKTLRVVPPEGLSP